MNSLYVLRTSTLDSVADSARSVDGAGSVAGARSLAGTGFFVGAGFFEAAGFSVGKIGLQTVPATLAAVPGLLVTAERAGGVELVERVGPHHAGAQPVGDG